MWYSFKHAARPGPLHAPPVYSDYAFFFLEVFDWLFDEYNIDTNRVYGSGMVKRRIVNDHISHAYASLHGDSKPLITAAVPSAGGFQKLEDSLVYSILGRETFLLLGQNDGNSNPRGSLHAFDQLEKWALDNVFWWVVDAGHSPHSLGWNIADIVEWMFAQTQEDLPLRPTATFTTDITDEDVPFTINCNASGSTPNNGGSIASYKWEIFKSKASIADYSDRYLHGYTLDSGFINATEVSTSATMQYTIEEPGIYWVRVIVTDNDGNRKAKTQQIFARSIKPEASFIFSKNHERAQQSITFDASESKADYLATISSYAWSFGDGNNASGIHVSHAYENAGTYSAELIVTSSTGAKDTTIHTVTVTDIFPGYRYFRFNGLTCYYTYRIPRIHHLAFLNGTEEFPAEAMTSNNSLGISLEASWEEGSDLAYKAFDKDDGTYWASHNYHAPVVLTMDVGESQRFIPTGMSMKMLNSGKRFVEFNIIASVDKYMWDTLYVNPSGNNDLEDVQFENVPYVSIQSPENNDSYNEGDSVNLTVIAANIPSSVDKVKYFADDIYIGESATADSFLFSWKNVPAGTYELTARAYYNSLADSVVSGSVNITVLGPPVFSGISITPLDVVVDSASTVQYTAEAVDQYGDPLASQSGFTWASTGGSIDASGFFTADDNVGTYYVKATATVNTTTITDSTSVTIKLPGSGCTEDFNDNTLSSMWTTIIQCEDSQGSVAETGGQLLIDAETDACNNFYTSPRKFFNGIISTPISGDFEVSVKVLSYSSATAGSRTGFIISPDVSEYGTSDAAGLASVNTRPGDNEFRLYTDTDQDGWLETSDGTGSVSTFPKWMKIERTGDDVSGYYSTDSINWTLIGTRTIGFGTSPMEVALVASQSSVVYDDVVFSNCPSVPVTPPVVSISADDSTVLEGTTVHFDGSASVPGSDASTITDYEWDFRDGNTATGATASNTFSTNGTYNVLLTLTDDMGNTSTDSLEITVDIATMLTTQKKADISIYPSPANNYVIVEGVSSEPYKIISFVGEVILSDTYKGRIDVSGLKPGVYLLEVQGKYLKFMKE